MGRVYLARDERLGRRVALKLLSKGRPTDASAILRFRREARLGAKLQHENLVRIYDEGEHQGQCYFVMEYIDGTSVGLLLDEHGPMPPATAGRLAFQVALGLDHAWQKGLIHRDVKPGNILVTREGIAKLADLGLAIEMGDDLAVTRDGSFLGSSDYISPEQARNSRKADARSDIYSLGCTLYHMIAGRVPFPFPSLPEKIQAQLAEDPQPLTELVPGVPEGLAGVVSRMMRKSPDDRYPDPSAVAKALEPFIDGVGRSDAKAILFPPSPSHGLPSNRLGALLLPPAFGRRGRRGRSSPPAHLAGSHRLFLVLGVRPADHPSPFKEFRWPRDLENAGVVRPDLGGHRQVQGPGGLDRLGDPGLPRQGAGARISGRTASLPADWRSRIVPLVGSAIALSVAIVLVLSFRGAGSRSIPEAEKGKVEGESGLVVVSRSPDGKETRLRNLKEALALDAESGLRIELRGRGPGPIRLESFETLNVLSGSVSIVADPASRPVLEVVLAGPDPFLRVGPRARLTLEGLSIRAEYAVRGPKIPPLIESGGALFLERCAFWTTDQAAKSVAVSSEGPRLAATGCWFGGFRQGLDVAAFSGTEVSLEQCMVIGNAGRDPSSGWAIRVRYEASNATEHRRGLTLRRCTISDACLLRADDFNPSVPLDVSIQKTAVQAGAMLSWNSESDPNAQSLKWSGQDNLYDISTASWVIRIDGPPPGPEGLIDADGWSLMTVDRSSRARAITFSKSADRFRSSPDPESFPTQEGSATQVGADPRLVGPGTSKNGP